MWSIPPNNKALRTDNANHAAPQQVVSSSSLKFEKNRNNLLKVDLSLACVTNYTETRAEWKEEGMHISQLFIFAFCLCNNQVKHHLHTRCSAVRASKLGPATLACRRRRKVAGTGSLVPADYVKGVERVAGLDCSEGICGQLIWKVPSCGNFEWKLKLASCPVMILSLIFNPLNRHSPLQALKTLSSSRMACCPLRISSTSVSEMCRLPFMLCSSENTANYEFVPLRRLGASYVHEHHLGFLPFITQQQQKGCISFLIIFNQFQNTLSETD